MGEQSNPQMMYVIASDGTRCTSEAVRDQYEEQVAQAGERESQRAADAEILRKIIEWLAGHRVSAEYVRVFYEGWSACSGYGNWLGVFREHFAGAKDRIIAAMLRRAKKNNWLVWRRENLLYIETPFGQCSWHMSKQRRSALLPQWFDKIVERDDLRWSGVRNTDRIVRRILGEKNINLTVEPKENASSDCKSANPTPEASLHVGRKRRRNSRRRDLNMK